MPWPTGATPTRPHAHTPTCLQWKGAYDLLVRFGRPLKRSRVSATRRELKLPHPTHQKCGGLSRSRLLSACRPNKSKLGSRHRDVGKWSGSRGRGRANSRKGRAAAVTATRVVPGCCLSLMRQRKEQHRRGERGGRESRERGKEDIEPSIGVIGITTKNPSYLH